MAQTPRTSARGNRKQARLDHDYAHGIYTDEQGHQHAPCGLCGCDCSTHPDAAHPLAHCGDCGAATCDEHRDQNDPASRCTTCATREHLREAHDRVICRIDDKGETVDAAVEAVYPDYGDLAFRQALINFVNGTR